jgi:F420-dependent methylenetetrahydromethanopterin dehydrogenase
MQRFFIPCLLMGLTVMTVAVQSGAQSKAYDEQALRIDAGPGTLRVVRGVNDSVVLKIGEFKSTDLSGVVASSSNAVGQARLFEKNYRPGLSLTGLGIALMGVGIGVSRVNVDPFITSAFTITSIGLIAYGSSRLVVAYRGLSKAIWWYNRDLKS